MLYTAQFTAFLTTAYALAIVVWPDSSLCGRASRLRFGGCATILFTPLLIAPKHVMLRALACVLAIDLFFKTVDYVLQQRRCSIDDERFLAYAAFLVPFPVFLVRFSQRSDRGRVDLSDSVATGAALAVFLLSLVLVGMWSNVEMVRSSFLVDHTVKFIIFTVAIESLARGLHGIERFVGYDTKPIINNAFQSLTVGEFRHRYNTRVHSLAPLILYGPR